MNALGKLWFLKQRATIRNLFRKPSSAILTILMVLLYGGLIVMMLNSGVGAQAQMLDAHMAVLLGLGMSGILALSMLMQKRKALFMEEDSFYLFSGPFSRKQVMRFLMAQTILQSLLFALLSAFMMLSLGSDSGLSGGFILLSVLGFFLLLFFFLTFTDYLYILSITNAKYKMASKLVGFGVIAIIAIIFLLSLAQNQFQIKDGLIEFAQGEIFYFVPMFGWVKLFLISAYAGNIAMASLGLGLMVASIAIIYYLFTTFKGDFYEQAMMDSIEVTKFMKEAKAGKQNNTRMNAKVHDKSIAFRQGAGAIFSKNYLMMKKTNDFIRTQDIMILVFYFVIAYFTELGFGMFCYMMIIYIFQLLQSSDLVQELKNYQIYLIPAKPFSKLMAALLPTLIKISLVSSAAVIVSGVIFQMGVLEILNWVIMLLGYAIVFVSATVLSIRILKSRTNIFMENLLRMFIIIACSLPSVLLIIYLIFEQGIYDIDVINMASYLSLVLNFVLSFLILYVCKGMMNGREINSD